MDCEQLLKYKVRVASVLMNFFGDLTKEVFYARGRRLADLAEKLDALRVQIENLFGSEDDDCRRATRLFLSKLNADIDGLLLLQVTGSADTDYRVTFNCLEDPDVKGCNYLIALGDIDETN